MITDSKTEPKPQIENEATVTASRNPQRALFWDVYRNTTPAPQK